MSEFRTSDQGQGMSWAGVWELRRKRQSDWKQGIRRAPPRERDEDGGYSFDEVLAEIRVIVGDTGRFLAEDPTSGLGALAAAEDVATVRDDQRLRARRQVPLGDFAALFAGWLIRRADRGDFPAAVQTAWQAVSDSPEQPVLGNELREYVRGYLDGSISGEESTRRQKHPKAKLTGKAARTTATGDAAASTAASTLSGFLAEVSPKAATADGLAAWDAFKRFAVLPFPPEAPERLDETGGDLLLCEWGVYDWPWSDDRPETFLIDLVRQFSVIAEDGEYERMEQVHCSMSFDPIPELRRLGSGTIWSDRDRQRWFAAVERSEAFGALRIAPPLEVRIERERL